MGKPKSKIDQLSDLMMTSAYPALFDVMGDLGLQEVEIKLDGAYSTHITLQHSAYFIDDNGQHSTLINDLFEKTIDQRMTLILSGNIKPYKTFPPEGYFKWCELVMEKIEELKLHLPRINSIAEKLNKISVTYTREVLIEKNIN